MSGSPFLSLACAAASAAWTLSAAPTSAQAPQAQTWIAWNDRLESVQGELVWLTGDGVRMRDDHGREIEIDAHNLVALMQTAPGSGPLVVAPMDAANAGGRPAIVELTDGQRWPCHVLATGGPEDLAVEIPNIGTASLPLDVITRIVFDRAMQARDAPAAAEDRVVLVNRDVIEGTVLSMASDIEIDSGGSVMSIPAASVAVVELVNPPIRPAPMRLWLDGGAVFAAPALVGGSTSELQCTLIAPNGRGWHEISVWKPWDRSANHALEAVEFAPGRLVPWASLQVRSFAPEGERRWAPPPAVQEGPCLLDLAQVGLPGPMRVTWHLPAGAQYACAQVSLADPSSPWADCVVRVEQQGRMLWEQRLNAAQPRSSWAVRLDDDADLTLRVLEGEYGPIDDRVLLSLGWVLLGSHDESD
ncbi:MAG: hypothetical protein Kow0022_17560 [Phycisphaerales bacterium]